MNNDCLVFMAAFLMLCVDSVLTKEDLLRSKKTDWGCTIGHIQSGFERNPVSNLCVGIEVNRSLIVALLEAVDQRAFAVVGIPGTVSCVVAISTIE